MSVDVQWQPTPNPNSMKFTVNRQVTDGGSRTYDSAADAGDDPVAAAILAIDGVDSVFMVNDFITVTREAGADWNDLVPAVTEAIEEGYGE